MRPRSWAFLRSVSKPYGPDLRIAVLAGDEATVARVAGRMRVGAGWVSTVLQTPGARACGATSGSARRWRRRGTATSGRRTGLRAALSRARRRRPPGATGINVWVPVGDETRAVTALRDAGYAVAPGSLFRVDVRPGIRITVSPLDDDDLGRSRPRSPGRRRHALALLRRVIGQSDFGLRSPFGRDGRRTQVGVPVCGDVGRSADGVDPAQSG